MLDEIFAVARAYSEDFEPLFIQAEDLEDAKKKIKETFPTGWYTVYKLAKYVRPVIAGNSDDIRALEIVIPRFHV